jgi:hypothetical protein
MGRHEEPESAVASRNFWGTFRLVLKQPLSLPLGLLAIGIGFAILAVHIQNRYGGIWGALVGGCIAPLVGGSLLKARLNRRDRR